ncbi:CRISPR-associated Cas2 family protein [Hydrogenivirga caldilitoris]|uniref:CRISPR-associated endoribonuclease Cas2 n=1 Tax=Hydrogenivirga caldilitoris TaxID=246264 RepID=A0A497XNZ6_9AQUI|nr:CRISPR-associated endonuclease Cas2 [Hydrogenivirga caldilitoris]RLJ70696.1 CRISPR-associated Cas2 family protein [Hydrogenivirga caldilitoris]
MRVILVYDIAVSEPADQSRLNRVRKVVRKYINHVQKSVFEGDISPSKLERLEHEVLSVVDRDRDFVIIYVFESGTSYERRIITNSDDPTKNVI